ncbi:hypothetical protein [endosymbiont 'TC1' of Trimyema compressum]|uniref:hypothetical protein n=1 Tax=endosymbiont 'TC1' of Trimyema compressum TaxID=243899 RepID=UPI00139226F6|nr:hypothetical protein [endosymbiont 'TC1' of Trimyema compressum]
MDTVTSAYSRHAFFNIGAKASIVVLMPPEAFILVLGAPAFIKSIFSKVAPLFGQTH